MGKLRRKTLLACISSSISACIILGTSITFAGFAATDRANQTIYASGGIIKKSIFLDCENLWNILGTEVIYMHAWNSNNASTTNEWVLPTRTVTMSITGTGVSGSRNLYVFEYDTSKYNKLLFARVNPDGLTADNVGSKIWNKTYNRNLNDTINYYYLDAWVNNTIYAHNYKGKISSSAPGTVSDYSADNNEDT